MVDGLSGGDQCKGPSYKEACDQFRAALAEGNVRIVPKTYANRSSNSARRRR